jgi:anti-sigma B factor antagonist
MNIEIQNTTLVISGLSELTAITATELKAAVRNQFAAGLKDIDFDCAGLGFVDSSGLGTLISLQKLAVERGGKFRLLAPGAQVLQVLELTRMHRVFEIVQP